MNYELDWTVPFDASISAITFLTGRAHPNQENILSHFTLSNSQAVVLLL